MTWLGIRLRPAVPMSFGCTTSCPAARKQLNDTPSTEFVVEVHSQLAKLLFELR